LATAEACDEIHVVLENLEALLRAEAEHPLDERDVDGAGRFVVLASGRTG
jgi:hypothetical protein